VVQEFLYKDLTYSIIGAAIEVHKVLGHGFPSAGSGQVWSRSTRKLLRTNSAYVDSLMSAKSNWPCTIRKSSLASSDLISWWIVRS